MMPQKIFPPWDQGIVYELNAYQADAFVHPFTCPNRPHSGSPEGVLKAQTEGWRCEGCDYTQDWAWEFMSEPEFRLKMAELHHLPRWGGGR